MPTVDTSNSYVTEAEATTYFANRLYADAWASATAEDKQKALLMARTLLDFHIIWSGYPTDDTQPLQWPRIGVTGIALDAVPESVKIAQMELALILLSQDTTAMPANPGVKRQTVDVITEEFFAGADKAKPIPDRVFQLIAVYGRRAGGLGSVSLTR